MRCTRYETDLALYVEGDLPGGEILAIEAHIASCPTCRGLLSALRASQRAVRALAAAPVDEAALARVRARIVAARAQSYAHQPPHWRWAVAAGLATVTAGALWLAMLNGVKPDAPRVREAETSPSTSPVASPPTPPRNALIRRPERQPEGKRPSLPVERHLSPHLDQHVVTAPALTPDDADQLARAVVVLSRIESLSDAVREPPPPPSPTPLVRWATADPNVVIYWRLESTGGE
jgi:anti-sigma factor RsiW